MQEFLLYIRFWRHNLVVMSEQKPYKNRIILFIHFE